MYIIPMFNYIFVLCAHFLNLSTYYIVPTSHFDNN